MNPADRIPLQRQGHQVTAVLQRLLIIIIIIIIAVIISVIIVTLGMICRRL